MNSITTKDFNIFNAENFETIISDNLESVYVLLSRSQPWANTVNGSLDDTTIETPYDTTDYKNQIFRNALVLKRIRGNDVQAIVPRIDWNANTVYFAYDQTANLYIKSLNTLIPGGNVNVSLSLANTVVSNTINLKFTTPSLSDGNFITIGNETKEIVRINAAGDFLQVNSNFVSAYTQQSLYKTVSSDYQYSYKFYVRNTADQVFKCLFNNNNAESTFMPEITIGGQLPENPYIETADGYKWKYLYTIPSGLKNRFFNNEYMPVVNDATVAKTSKNGRIDVIQILNGGTGYYANSSVNNYSILSLDGDGNGAVLSADILNGSIVEVNILNGGYDYTTANVIVNDPLQTLTGLDANLRVVISPQYGHGNNNPRELGSSERMVAVDFRGSLDGFLPVKSDGTDDFRQVCLVKNPKLPNNVIATNSVIPLYTKLFVDSTPLPGFSTDATVFVSETGNIANAVFTAKVVHFDTTESIIYVNNITGNVDVISSETIYQNGNPSIFSQVFSVEKPSINNFSGDIMYIENRSKVIRSPDQTETVKLVVKF